MSLSSPHLTATPFRQNWREHLQTAVVLFKLRVVSLLLVASVGGAFLAADGFPGWGPLFLVLLTGGMSAARCKLPQPIHRTR